MKKLFACCMAALILLTAFTFRKKNKLKLPEEFAFVNRGTMHAGPDTCSLHNQPDPHRVTVPSFYISKYEVTNLQYRQFYNEVSAGLTDEIKEKIACDTLGWRQTLTYCEPMVEYYYRHPAYNNYPVVNISYEGAMKYCEWLQKKIQADNPAYTIEVKLPEKNQWIYAAQGGRSNAMFPWGNYYLRNKKGEFLCNFRKLGDGAIVRNKQTGKPEVYEMADGAAGGLNDRAFYTAEVKSFYPNDFGLHNICGNVAEMVNEKGTAMGGSWNDYGGDVHIKSEAGYDKASPTVGFRPAVIFKEKGNR
jgi:formylglycine-generating enzyme required for sulfatase activity